MDSRREDNICYDELFCEARDCGECESNAEEEINMGLDMLCYIRNKNGENLTDNLVDFRDSLYFQEIMGQGERIEYNILSDKMSFIKELFTKEIKEEEKEREKGYTTGNYGFKAISVKDFKDWYERYKPYKRAGYLTVYQAWLYNAKGIAPYEENIIYYTSKEEQEEQNLVFTEFTKDDFTTEIMKIINITRMDYITKKGEDIVGGFKTRAEIAKEFDENTYICFYFNR